MRFLVHSVAVKWSREEDGETYAVIGAAMEVHNHLGHRFLELAYHRALSMELETRGIPRRSEVEIPLAYKGRDLGVTWRADMVCFQDLLVELKAIPSLGRQERAQLRHYVVATGRERGLLINFGASSLQFERVTANSTQSLIPEDIPASQDSQTSALGETFGTRSLQFERVTANNSQSLIPEDIPASQESQTSAAG
jgi:GxxExxY protein